MAYLSLSSPVGTGPTLGPSVASLIAAYRCGAITPVAVCDEILAAISERGADGTWISVASLRNVRARCTELAAIPGAESLPLYGVPFGVKDSIDVAGWPTTLACPDYAYRGDRRPRRWCSRLLDAGAIYVGKTNLDQFATGLNGTRTPYPIPRSVFGGDLISGGSSSGSALAVALGRGAVRGGHRHRRVRAGCPPALNGVVGFKPSRG